MQKLSPTPQPVGALTLAGTHAPRSILSASTLPCHEGTLLQFRSIAKESPEKEEDERANKPPRPLTTSFLFPTIELPGGTKDVTLEERARRPRQITFDFSSDLNQVTLSTTEPPLEIDLLGETYRALPRLASIDRGLGEAGCFHTGRFSLTRGAETLLEAQSAFAYYTRSREVYTLVHEIDERTAITILLYLPSHLMTQTLPLEVELAQVFKDPAANTVRAFIKTRTHAPDAPHTLSWSARPIEQGKLQLTLPQSARKLSAQSTVLPEIDVELDGLDLSLYPELSSLPGKPVGPLTLKARHAIIPDGQGLRLPPIPK